MRNILFFCLWLSVVAWASGAETWTLTDGSSLSGDIVKYDDNGLFLRLAGETYTNVPWAHFSQAALKQLAQNPKINPFVDVFIEPTESEHPAKAEIKINPVIRLERPAKPALFGGLIQSPVGLVILLILYAANLYAAYEISIFRARPTLQVIGLAAAFPVIGPIIFLAMPTKMEAAVETGDESETAGADPAVAPVEEIQIVEASWNQEEKQSEAQIFPRGRFTFNKRFVETKFAGFIGTPTGDALKFDLTVKTAQADFMVARIAQVNQTEAIFETANGPVSVALADIQEIKLNPKPA